MNVDAASAALIQMFVTQCRYGKQSAVLPTGYAACGQFIGAPERRQRGLFGTAAAVSALSSEPTTNASLLQDLVHYLADRATVEASLSDGATDDKIARDESDVIKLSDELRALARVPLTVAATEPQRRVIVDILLRNVQNEQGWPYFLTDSPVDVIPTAYAFRALTEARASDPLLRRVRDYLLYQLRSTVNTAQAIDDVTRLLIVWALSSAPDGDNRTLKQAFLNLRKSLDASMRYRIEQNVEYWSKEKSHYVRIPWQLYYVELALRHAPLRVFSTRRVQLHLRGVVADAERGGYIYPHSGRHVSARTSAAVLDLLHLVKTRLTSVRVLTALTMIDAVRQFLGSRLVRVPLGMLAFYAIGTSLYEASTGRATLLADVAPDLIAAALLAALFGRER